MSKEKVCWISRETDDGWSLALCVEDKEINLGILLAEEADVEKVLDSGLVFVHKDDTYVN